MLAMTRRDSLIDRLPPIRGRLTARAPLAQATWFRVGGPAEMLFKPADRDDLSAVLAGLPDDIPVTVLGVASNLIIRDGGIRGVVIRLGRAFTDIRVEGTRVIAGAAALDANIARASVEAGLTGLEFLVGIPGTLGGGMRTNAGAYGTELKDVLISATIVDRQGRVRTVDAADLGFSYRHCAAPADWILVEAALRAEPGNREAGLARMAEIGAKRAATQPVRARTGGSTFANPPGLSAWQVIEAAGCRGLRLGGAMVSEQHCNFLINTGDATAADLEGLGERVRETVRADSGIDLRWEIRRIGEAG